MKNIIEFFFSLAPYLYSWLVVVLNGQELEKMV